MPNKPKEDLTGKRFKRLKVLKYSSGGKWECLCDCGKTVSVKTNALTSGNTQSCGCLNLENVRAKKRNFVDYTGRKYDGFEVLRYVKSGKNGTEWECKCLICGRLFVTAACNFKAYKSCGCLEKKNRLDNVAALHDKTKTTGTSPNILREEPNSNSKTGIRGVCYLAKTETYVAYISYKGKRYTLKRSRSIDECIKAREQAEKVIRDLAKANFDDYDGNN